MTRKVMVVLAVVVLTIGFGCGEKTSMVSGRLKSSDGQPAVNLIVKFENRSDLAISDEKGEFAFSLGITRGNQTLVIKGKGYQDKKIPVVLQEKEEKFEFVVFPIPKVEEPREPAMKFENGVLLIDESRLTKDTK